MKKFVTGLQATDPIDGELKVWAGPTIESENWEEAVKYLVRNGLGYCFIVGEFVEEIGWNAALFASKLDDFKNNNN